MKQISQLLLIWKTTSRCAIRWGIFAKPGTNHNSSMTWPDLTISAQLFHSNRGWCCLVLFCYGIIFHSKTSLWFLFLKYKNLIVSFQSKGYRHQWNHHRSTNTTSATITASSLRYCNSTFSPAFNISKLWICLAFSLGICLMLPIPPSVGEILVGKQVYSFVSSYFSFKQNIICPFKGDNSNSSSMEATSILG